MTILKEDCKMGEVENCVKSNEVEQTCETKLERKCKVVNENICETVTNPKCVNINTEFCNTEDTEVCTTGREGVRIILDYKNNTGIFIFSINFY